MRSTPLYVREMAAPSTLGLETRVAFRRAAIELLESVPEGEGRLVVDLAHTQHIDSAGLGALMLVQRRAAERRQTVVLENPSDELRFLLNITKLSPLFEFEPAGV
jgi:anti-anti-sigma factor